MVGQGLVSYALVPALTALMVICVYSLLIITGRFEWWCCWLPLVLGYGGVAIRWFTDKGNHWRRKRSQ